MITTGKVNNPQYLVATNLFEMFKVILTRSVGFLEMVQSILTRCVISSQDNFTNFKVY